MSTLDIFEHFIIDAAVKAERLTVDEIHSPQELTKIQMLRTIRILEEYRLLRHSPDHEQYIKILPGWPPPDDACLTCMLVEGAEGT